MRKILKFLILSLSIILIVAFIFFFHEFFIYIGQKLLIKEIELKSEINPLVIKIEKIENGNVFFIAKFLDIDGNVVYFLQDSIVGQYLFVDFLVYKEGSNYFFFPYLVFSDVVPSDYGKDLTKAYLKDGFPEIYRKKNMDEFYINKLIEIYSKAFNRANFKEGSKSFGNALHIIKKVESIDFSSYIYYICNIKKGGIEVITK
ncbi:MAG: hypothetical protein N3A58_07260 [Spirochaetes bacterium]|nr:hypothetical protein [Spirochaetota bacterium]